MDVTIAGAALLLINILRILNPTRFQMVVVARKVTVLALSVFLSKEELQTQSVLVSGVLFVSVALHCRYWPFVEDELNYAELASICRRGTHTHPPTHPPHTCTQAQKILHTEHTDANAHGPRCVQRGGGHGTGPVPNRRQERRRRPHHPHGRTRHYDCHIHFSPTLT